MAVLPWDFEAGMTPLRALLLVNSVAVLLVELAVVIWAIGMDCSPLAAAARSSRSTLVPLAALFGIAVWTAATVAPQPADAVAGLVTWLIHILFGLSIWSLVRKKIIAFDARTWAWVSSGVLAYGVMLALFLVSRTDLDRLDWSQIMPGVLQIRNLGVFFVAGYFAALPLAVSGTERWHVIIGAALGSVSLGLALWTGTRGALIAIASGLLATALLAPQFRSKAVAAYVTATSVLGVALALLYQPPVPYMGLQRYLDPAPMASTVHPQFGRFAIWRATVRAIGERPVLGHGERQFSAVVFRDRASFKQPHNVVLQLLLQWGAVGAILSIALLSRLGYIALRGVRTFSTDELAAAAILTSLIAYGFYDAAFYYPYPVMIMALCVAILSGRDPVTKCGVHPIGKQKIG
jgi:hypothetical protein